MPGVAKMVRCCVECSQLRRSKFTGEVFRCGVCRRRQQQIQGINQCRQCEATIPLGKQFCDSCKRSHLQQHYARSMGGYRRPRERCRATEPKMDLSRGFPVLAVLPGEDVEQERKRRIAIYHEQYEKSRQLNFTDPRLWDPPAVAPEVCA